MRLLNTSSVALEEFQGTAPEYAISSHTWLDGEVTLQDLTLDRGRTKAGRNKIINCIDKTSSAELSEAINSMFAWYQRAAVCYAFLSDVKGVRRGDELGTFARSRWFTRGWTLQELIAPLYLVFLDSSWREIGSRSYLSSTIEKITGISSFQMAHFIGCSAYCLLGLSGVNMPLFYGEEEKAFIRLQQEILKVSDDETIFAWQGKSARRKAMFPAK
ncbi:HET-domain-containing protein [Daldinia sp. FL1419]|nr:HET-domain-containing protein [Daldinia sp. FL1419]